MAEVIIVGAGPAGSVLATLLARKGIETLLVDKARFPREKVCGDYLSPGTLRFLDRLGVLGEIRSAGARPLWGMTITSPDGTTFRAEYPAGAAGNGARPHALSLRRAVLDVLLVERARQGGVKCLEGFRVIDLVWGEGRVCGVTGIGRWGLETHRGRVVVGADGRASVVARRLGLQRAHPTLDRMALLAYYQGQGPCPQHGAICIGDGAYCILNPIAEDTVNASLVLDRAEVLPWKGDLEGLFERRLRSFAPATAALAPLRQRTAVRCLGPLAVRAKRTSKAGALLIGDAAGFTDPFTGEGVFEAVRGAELAAQEIVGALARGGTPPRHWHRFDARLRSALAGKRRLEATLQAVLRRPGLANTVARFLREHPPLADRLLGAIGDLIPPRSLLTIDFWSGAGDLTQASASDHRSPRHPEGAGG